jgi:hypothetical protein
MCMYSLPNIIRVIKSIIICVEHVVRTGNRRGAYRGLVGKPEREISFRRARHRWEDNIKMHLQQVIDLAQKKGQVTGSCKCGNKPLGPIKYVKFLG